MNLVKLQYPDREMYKNLIPEAIWEEEPQLILATDDFKTVGIAAYLVEEESLVLEWLYVFEGYRRKGYADQMISFLEEQAKKEKCQAVIALYPGTLDPNPLNLLFMKHFYDFDLEEAIIYKADKKTLQQAQIHNYKVSSNKASDDMLYSVSEYGLPKLRKYIQENYNNGKMDEEQADLSDLDSQMSHVLVNKNQIKGFLKIQNGEDDGQKLLTLLYMSGAKNLEFFTFLKNTIQKILKDDPAFDTLHFICMDDRLCDLTEKLLGEEIEKETESTVVAEKLL